MFLGFNGHPPLGVNATLLLCANYYEEDRQFQWAPTLGGECYDILYDLTGEWEPVKFQWAPTLGGECYPPILPLMILTLKTSFQWAPTLGGECYSCMSFPTDTGVGCVSMGTHPWG